MKQNLSTVKRSIFYLAFCFSLLFCFSCIGRFSTVGNVVAAIGGVAGVVAGGSTTIQGNQTPKLPDYEDPVMQTVIDEEETPL